jgi:hypothetical protein
VHGVICATFGFAVAGEKAVAVDPGMEPRVR